jgi:acetylornithine/succinyldiaminopimelate/putrescine aminotransferase
MRQFFFRHVAQTSPSPLALHIVKAEGSILWDAEGKQFIDLIAGIGVCNIGHRHPKVVEAIKQQADAYLHVMVYGELIETPQVQYAHYLSQRLPMFFDSIYFTNSGAEAIEGAMKLAKRYTNRTQIIAFKNSYHGSTQGALSIIGDEYWRNAYRPLLPDVLHLNFNAHEDLSFITKNTACVIVEPVQAEAGVIKAERQWMQALREKCVQTETLLIFDEVQTGFGRTGNLWGLEQSYIAPDIIVLGKAIGGGMPLGAFASNIQVMQCLTNHPVLGHITTFGGHPVCCAAGLAATKALTEENIIAAVEKKEQLFLSLLKHPKIKSIRSSGLLIAVEFDSYEINKKIIDKCIADGVLTDWFLFAPNCLRIAPPLNISDEHIKKACSIIIHAIEAS